MSTTIHKKDDAQSIKEAIKEASSKQKKKSFDFSKYFGKVDFGMDGLTFQKKVRDEWK